MDEIVERFAIITSLFPKKDTGEPNEQIYVSHLKVWQEAGSPGESMQCRYIVLSEGHDGSALLRKSKLNSNGTFSVGKTFRLSGLRKVVVSSPYLFSLYFSKTYKWRSEARADQAEFLETLITTFRKVTNGQISLQLKGIHDYDAPSHSAPDSSQIDGKGPSSTRDCNETSCRQILAPQNDSVALTPTMCTNANPPLKSASPSFVKQDPSVHSASCFFCDSRIVGDRYKCLDCPDFDCCSACFVITPQQHPDHAFVRIKAPDDHIRTRHSVKQMHDTSCKGCSMTIYGCRFKCMHPECPDYDLCEACEALPIPVHSTLHPMLKIRNPRALIPLVRRGMHENLASPSQPVTPPELIPELDFGEMVCQLPTPIDPNPRSNSLTSKDDKAEIPMRRPLPVPRTITALVDPVQPSNYLTNTNPFADIILPDKPKPISTSTCNLEAVVPMEIRPSCSSNLTLTKPAKLHEPIHINTDNPSIAIDRPLVAQAGLEELTKGKGRHPRSTAYLISSGTVVISPEEEDDIDLVSVPSSPIDDDDEGLFRESRSHVSPGSALNGRTLHQSHSAADYVFVDGTVYKH